MVSFDGAGVGPLLGALVGALAGAEVGTPGALVGAAVGPDVGALGAVVGAPVQAEVGEFEAWVTGGRTRTCIRVSSKLRGSSAYKHAVLGWQERANNNHHLLGRSLAQWW